MPKHSRVRGDHCSLISATPEGATQATRFGVQNHQPFATGKDDGMNLAPPPLVARRLGRSPVSFFVLPLAVTESNLAYI